MLKITYVQFQIKLEFQNKYIHKSIKRHATSLLI